MLLASPTGDSAGEEKTDGAKLAAADDRSALHAGRTLQDRSRVLPRGAGPDGGHEGTRVLDDARDGRAQAARGRGRGHQRRGTDALLVKRQRRDARASRQQTRRTRQCGRLSQRSTRQASSSWGGFSRYRRSKASFAACQGMGHTRKADASAARCS